jgi:hypothetical protein
VLTGAALIIGFMLAGVMADYKESEKIPAELASSLEAIEDTLQALEDAGKPVPLPELLSRHYELTCVIEDWLLNRGTLAACYEAIQSLNAITGAMDRAGASTSYTSRSLVETHNIRRSVTRIDVIRRTSFISAGYVLLEVFVITTHIMLLMASFENSVMQYLVIAFLSLMYLYLYRLIQDLDDPFGYAPSGAELGTSEVSPEPVLAYRQRLEASLAAAHAKNSAAVSAH